LVFKIVNIGVSDEAKDALPWGRLWGGGKSFGQALKEVFVLLIGGGKNF